MSQQAEIIIDPKFKSGFFLQDPNPVTDQRVNFRYLDYDGQAIVPSQRIWYMTQWWTPFPFHKAKFSAEGRIYRYENENRRCDVDTEIGGFAFELDSYQEYLKLYGGSRSSPNQNWSHFLLEQDFRMPLRFRKMKALFARVTFQIDEVTNLDPKNYDPSLHAAQFLWYITIRKYEKEERVNNPLKDNFIWLGIPIYDNRFKTIEASQRVDRGFAGATNTLIYSLASSNYLKEEPLQLGKEYIIDFDIFPYIKKSIRYAIREGVFDSEKNLFVNYMNIGWELPGSFRVRSSIKELHLEAIIDE